MDALFVVVIMDTAAFIGAFDLSLAFGLFLVENHTLYILAVEKICREAMGSKPVIANGRWF